MSTFFAWLSRLKLISRWGLMHSARPENDAEHSLQTAMIAHGLAVIGNRRLGRHYDENKTVTLAVYHDVSEIFTGDLPTPVKHHDKMIRDAYHRQEQAALSRLLLTLPEDLRPGFADSLLPDEAAPECKLVKAADRISAYAKCMEELQCGNREFASAARNIRASIAALQLEEADIFMNEFSDGFNMTLDEL
ncbi:MAG: 5'-deoxynucleotidase [Clostridia bacterium]|nr:5'-deoxynucleotidase [Clostridia bacterium]